MLFFNREIFLNIGVFFCYKNNVDIFVEDNYDEEFYKVIINWIIEKNGY